MIKYYRVLRKDISKSEFEKYIEDISFGYNLKIYTLNDETIWKVRVGNIDSFISYFSGMLSNDQEQKLLKEEGLSKTISLPR